MSVLVVLASIWLVVVPALTVATCLAGSRLGERRVARASRRA